MNGRKQVFISIIGIAFLLFILGACSITPGVGTIVTNAHPSPSVASNTPISITVHQLPAAATAKPSPTAANHKNSGTTPASTPTSTTQPGTGAKGATAMENQIAQSVFQAINQSRASNGLPPLQWSTALVNSAWKHDLTMQAANTLSHQLPGEAALGERETQQGVNWSWAGENIGETSDETVNGALSLHQAMMNEKPPDDGHRQNILSTNYNIVGVAILIDSSNGKLWLTEDFAKV